MTVDRRELLQLGGALLLAFHLPACAVMPARPAVLRHFDETGDLVPNAWLRITPDDRVIFILDRVEMGQGTMTSSAMMVAEELEVDPAAIEIELAGADRAYDMVGGELGIQNTGGSESTATSWEPLRRAGATTRELLRRGAAATWGVPVEQCEAKGGAIHHAASGRTARYGALVAAAVAAAKDGLPRPALKPPDQFRSIGTTPVRLDARAKSTGAAVFGIDVALPGMVHATIVRPPAIGAELRSLDAAAARARPGVIDVFAIDRGVAVVAKTTWQAMRAAEAVRAEWRPSPLGSTPAWRATLARLARGDGGKAVVKRGRAPQTIDGAPRRVEALYEQPHLAHATLEPQNCTAHFHDGGCELWAPTQSPGMARLDVAERLGLDLADVLVHQTLLGGGFGRRLAQDYCVEAAVIARHVRVPVKVTWSREDDFAVDFYRPMVASWMRAGIGADGALTGWHHHHVAEGIPGSATSYFPTFLGAVPPNGAPRTLRRMIAGSVRPLASRNTVPDPDAIVGAADTSYAFPTMRFDFTPVESGVPVGFWRGVGHTHTAFPIEAFVDEVAAAMRRDPVALRRGLLHGSPRDLAVLELAANRAGWGSPLPRGVGRGIAVHAAFKSYCAMAMEVECDGRAVRVRRVVAAVDCGQVIHPELVAMQIESSVVFGLSAALRQEITIERGRVMQTNFHQFPLLRMHECPAIEVHLVPSREPPTGVGELGLPPVAPALVNAIAAACGKRIRRLPVEAALAEVP
jgi:isoquinoline 1-oxidoreductase subunit beta